MAQNSHFETRSGLTTRATTERWAPDRVFVVVTAFIILTFLFGGSARDDVAALALLRPVAIALCAWTLRNLSPLSRAQARLLWLVMAIIALPLVHLIPLPPMIWTRLPGHDLISRIDQATQGSGLWRPLTVAPVQTANALFSLVVPLAVLLSGFSLRAADQRRLILIVLACGAASAVLGVVQVLSPQVEWLYPYKIMTANAPDGFFANRNHQALFQALLVPMLAVYASRHDDERSVPLHRNVTALIGVLMIVLLLALAGSRAGLVGLVLGGAAVPLLYRSGAAHNNLGLRQRLLGGAALLVSVAVLGIIGLSDRSVAIRRALASRWADESRLDFIDPVIAATRSYFPFGSGIGSFNQAYRVVEPAKLLNAEYLNHAHNDFLELAMTGGLPAIVLMIGMMAVVCRYGLAHARDRTGSDAARYGRLGVVCCAIVAMGSAVDYPVRVPAIMVVVAVAVLWMTGGTVSRDDARGAASRNSPRID